MVRTRGAGRAQRAAGSSTTARKISCIREDALDEGELTARRPLHLAGTIAILHVGGMDDDSQQEAERIDDEVARASRDLQRDRTSGEPKYLRH
jgi:hypothetical protein